VPAIQIDYVGHRRVRVNAATLLLAVGAVMAAHAAYSHHAMVAETNRLSMRATELRAKRADPVDPTHLTNQSITSAEIDAMLEARRRLMVRWPDAFEPLEAVRPLGVRLTAIDPDPTTQSLLISGEASEYLLILGYVSSLKSASGLRDVQLVRHDQQAKGVPFPMTFTVSAKWRSWP
jgi:hypothetical protein